MWGNGREWLKKVQDGRDEDWGKSRNRCFALKYENIDFFFCFSPDLSCFFDALALMAIDSFQILRRVTREFLVSGKALKTNQKYAPWYSTAFTTRFEIFSRLCFMSLLTTIWILYQIHNKHCTKERYNPLVNYHCMLNWGSHRRNDSICRIYGFDVISFHCKVVCQVLLLFTIT